MEDIYQFCGTTESVTEDQIAAWRKKVVSWQIIGDLPGLSRVDFRGAVHQAFTSWQEVCGLKFQETNTTPDIVLTTGRIDRAGGVLAWSELPDGSDRQLQQKYDTSEAYIIAINPPRNKIDLVAVSCHEIGHALGLDHAAQGASDLMAPTYQPGKRTPQEGDISRIQRLYPKIITPTPEPTPDPTPPVPGNPVVIYIYGADRIVIPGFTIRKDQ